MPITDPQVIEFSNRYVRPGSDREFYLYFFAKQAIANYAAGDIGTKITVAGPGETLADGAATDGRTEITGGDIFESMNVYMDYVKFVENQAVPTADRTTAITKPHVNGF